MIQVILYFELTLFGYSGLIRVLGYALCFDHISMLLCVESGRANRPGSSSRLMERHDTYKKMIKGLEVSEGEI